MLSWLTTATGPRRLSPAWLGPFRSRPFLVTAIVIGAVVGLLLLVLPDGLDQSTNTIVALDALCLSYIAMMIAQIRKRDASYIRTVAAAQDEGQGMILGLVTLLAAASLAAVAADLSAAKDAHGFGLASRIGLAVVTVSASWFMTHLIFALHYAHEYYAPDDDGDPATKQVGGLEFPGGEPPDYWDFVHFAVVIGVASQTADIQFTSKRMRRIGTVHGVVAFTFNTVVLALTINVLAGML